MALLGYSVPETLTDDAGNAMKGITVTVTGPSAYSGTATTNATTGVLRLGPLPPGDYTVTYGSRSVTVPIVVSLPSGGTTGQVIGLNGGTTPGWVDPPSSGQPLDSDLTTISALDSSSAGVLSTDGAGWIRKTYAQLKTALALTKSDVGLGNVDNTSDVNKPVSTATTAAIAAQATTDRGTYAPLDARDTSITSFTVGMLVSSGSSIYRVTTAHAAPFDSTKATQQGGTSVATAPAWADATAYTVGNLVSSGTTLYRATTAHTSSGSIDLTKFTAVGGSSVETVNTVASSGSAVTIPDVTTATLNDVKLTAATVAFTFPTAAAGKSFTLLVRQDTTGGRLATWPSTVKWDANAAPTLSTGASKYDILAFTCFDGTNWEGVVVGQNKGVTPTLVTDSFTRADAATLGTAETGQTWVGTSVGIVSNQAAVKAAGVTYAESGAADITYSLKWVTQGSQMRQVFRYTDANNYWEVQNLSGYTLLKKVGGSFTSMGNYPTAAVNDVVTVVTSGTSIIVKVNGSTVITSPGDSFNQTATKHGFDSGGGDTTSRWDDLSITAP